MGRLRKYLATTSYDLSYTARAARVVSSIKRNIIQSLTSCKRTEVYTNVDAKEPNSFQTPEEYLDEVKLDEIVEEDENTNEILESEFDPASLLNHWLEELDMSKMMLHKQGKCLQRPKESTTIKDHSKAKKREKRCSIIKLDSIEDDEMLAIIGDLTVLQSQLEKEIQSEREKRESFKSEIGDETKSLIRSAISDKEENIKAENIKIAIEKIKEASIKKLFIKVFTSDGSSKSLLVDETMTVSQVTQILAEKNLVTLSPLWALVELVPELCIERVYEDHELLVDNCLLWNADSKNTLWFMERPEKCDIFFRPEEYFSPKMEEYTKQELFEEYFSGISSSVLEVEGTIWLKIGKQKQWKKHFCVLRSDGVYYQPKKKKKPTDLVCLATFSVNEVYYGVGWAGRYKAPSEFCFGIKHPQIQAKHSKNMRYFCVETEMELHRWVTGIRLAKNGQKLCDNYQDILEDMAHTDIDQLKKRRCSINSFDCLKIFTKSNEQDRTDLTPSSENKSFDSAFSSGPGSDVSISGVNRKTELSLYASSSSGCMSGHSSLSDVTLAQDDHDDHDSLPLPPPPTAHSVTSLNMMDSLPPPPPGTVFHQTDFADFAHGAEPCSCQLPGELDAKHEAKQFSRIETPSSSKKITFDERVQVIHGEEETSQKLIFERDCDECLEENLANKWCLNKSDLYDVIGRRKTTFKTFFEDVWFEEDRTSSQDTDPEQYWHQGHSRS